MIKNKLLFYLAAFSFFLTANFDLTALAKKSSCNSKTHAEHFLLNLQTHIGQFSSANPASIRDFTPANHHRRPDTPLTPKAGTKTWNPVTGSGPLGDDVAKTFRSATYTERVTTKPTIVYRTYGGSSNKVGPYWTSDVPKGPLQSKIDSALAPQWGNTAEKIVKIEIPPGTKIFEGKAASQATKLGGQLQGGGSQVYIPKVDPKWIVE